MKKILTLSIVALVFYCLPASAQYLKVKDGDGKIADDRVFANQPFRVEAVGTSGWSGGTPNRWAVGIGTVDNQLLDTQSGTTSGTYKVQRPFSSDLAVISTTGTNDQYGLARYIKVCDASFDAVADGVCINGQFTNTAINISLMGTGITAATATIYRNGTYVTAEYFETSTRSISVTGGGQYEIQLTFYGGNCNNGTLTSFVTIPALCLLEGPGGFGRGVEAEESFTWDANKVSLYPNPAAGNGTITVEMAEDLQGTSMQVLDQQGRVIKTVPVTGRKSSLQIDDLKRGVYFIRFDSEKYAGTRRLIIE
ncbi:MAG TPA: hypothetical protein DCE41_36335 [Cytophagales bacterium]|nr:hypothetical protein [Cytophagales bacterium]HAP60324.1 hypothetical protein [Cytophagales bacterium]